MAFSAAEEDRIKTIEQLLNKVQVAISNLMSKQQFKQLLLIKQKEVDALTKRIETLESEIQVLQSKLD